jgi:hypothetical protein
LLGQLVLDKGALALVVGMSGTILLLLIGTQILDWYWLALLTVASLAAGLYKLRGSIPSLYRLAQRIDRRLGLADELSTATYFSLNLDRDRQAICESQRREAEETAARVDIRQALPYQRSRYILPAAGLALVAFGLFAVRYVVTGSISLEPSLLRIASEGFFASPAEQAKNQPKNLNLVPDPFNPGNPDAPTTQNDLAPQDQLQSEESPNGDNPQAQDNSKEGADGKGDQNADGNDKQGKDGKEGDSKDGKQSDKDGQQKEGSQDKTGKSGESSSMLDKLKDALSDVLNKMKPNGDNNKSAQTKQQQQNDAGQKGQPSKQKSQDPGSQATPDSNQDGEKSPADDAKDASQEGKPSNQDAGNGAGKADGDKAAKEAKMLEAMGKISELIGKRSATVTGEVVVEVGSNKQQLKTAWSDQKANHVEAGSEIHRDEIPLMDQPYVQKYFEEIRKTPPASKAAKK